jgi:multidrug resistance efflux pump
LSSCDRKDTEKSGSKDQAKENTAVEEGAGSRSITAFGTVIAPGWREIQLPWSCRIVEIPVWEGDLVQRGETLIVLDAADFAYALENARLAAAAAGNRSEEAASQLASLEVQLAEVTSRRDRIKGLMDGGSVATQELDKVEAELEALQHERDAAAWALEAKRSETESLNKEYRRMQDQAGADHIDENRLVCPVETAVVAEILVSPGAEAEAGVSLLVLHDQSSLVVEADLPEEFVRDVSKGVEATVIPVADPDRSYTGRVTELAGRAKMINGETIIKIRVRLEEPDEFLREGFNVDVVINPEAEPGAENPGE